MLSSKSIFHRQPSLAGIIRAIKHEDDLADQEG